MTTEPLPSIDPEALSDVTGGGTLGYETLRAGLRLVGKSDALEKGYASGVRSWWEAGSYRAVKDAYNASGNWLGRLGFRSGRKEMVGYRDF